MRSYESHHECNQRAVDGHEKLINTFALETIKLLCGSEYTDENDKCDKIIDQTGKSNLKIIPKSPLTLLTKILNST